MDKEIMMKKFAEKWHWDNKDMLADMYDLVNQCVMFKVKWGIPIHPVIGELDEQTKGRCLGKGEIEEIFDNQNEK